MVSLLLSTGLLTPFGCRVNIIVNGESREIPSGTSVAGLLELLELAGRPVAVEVNFELVPHSQHTNHELAEGDQVEIVTLVGGG